LIFVNQARITRDALLPATRATGFAAAAVAQATTVDRLEYQGFDSRLQEKRMRGMKSVLFALAVSTVSAAALSAQDPNVYATVTAIDPTAVTQSRVVTLKNGATTTMTTYAAYQVVVTNNTTNALNNAYFNATAVNDTSPPVAVVFDSFVDTSGTVACNTPTTSLNCTLGNLAPKTTSATFLVIVRAPTSGAKISLSFSSGGYEGGSGPNSCCSYPGSNSGISLIDPTTDTTFNTHALSLLTKVGGTFFTGYAAVPSSTAPFGTRLNVPSNLTLPGGYSTALIDIPAVDPTCTSANLQNCQQSNLTIPTSSTDTTPLQFSPCDASDATTYDTCLNIILRVDSSQIKPGVKIGNVQIYYSHPDTTDPTTLVSEQVYPCSVSLALPCIRSSVYYKNKTVPGWSLELDGDFEWTVINDRNGSYKVF
jgi:hypothetical protein